MSAFEKLGMFYLGRPVDPDSGETVDSPLLLDARDLTTHAVCVGMTGSGKTGLCIDLLEEAALDGIPSLVIDPKGDMGNLLLTFPELDGPSFRPWVDGDAARRADLSVDEFANAQAALWKKGLAGWGQDGDRIRALRASADFKIYTPGSDAGEPISILSSFAAPSEEVRADDDLFRERVSTTAASLLGLIGIDADPLRSREHILISNVLEQLWRQGVKLDLAGLIRAIQQPPVSTIGVMDLETFYPEKDRFALAMQVNNLLAAPGFQAWLRGTPLDVGSLLYTPEGRPRVAILSIAHLPDNERMFFVSLLLNQTISWMRSRPGTSSLRALLYMDEIFGFAPPTAEPPSKKPLLTLLKQARAYGLGVVLATQNPVDLDYKGLSNTGTWFLGRLQTERDKMRVIDGLEGALRKGDGFDRGDLDRILSGLGKRVFLLHSVHRKGPELFNTRWAMSYLRGPLTRSQIGDLTDSTETAPTSHVALPVALGPDQVNHDTELPSQRPVLSKGVPQAFLPVEVPLGEDRLVYEAHLVGLGRVQFLDRKTKRLKHAEEIACLHPLPGTSVAPQWEQAEAIDICLEDLEQEPEPGAGFEGIEGPAIRATSYRGWRKSFSDYLYRNRDLTLFVSPSTGLASEPEESEADFRIRLAEYSRQHRSELTDKLQKKYAKRAQRLDDRLRRAMQAIEREKEQATGQKMQTAISFGATLLSAVLGRKTLGTRTLGRATTAARGVGRSMRAGQDVGRAQENAADLQQKIQDLNREMEDEIDLLEDRLDPLTETLESKALRPRRADVTVRDIRLVWLPFREASNGVRVAVWR
ncbi:MAG: DUF87 domain-containing protein [Acidobacteriota bacterium]|nr:DUF87 domain-containing protein [Acidobacteriota bacterium]